MVQVRSFGTDALVIGSMRYGEADRILTLYTRERGRLSALARGVRRTRSRIGGRVEPFSLVDVELYRGRGSLYTLTGADTIRSFRGIREKVFRLEEGARVLELLRAQFPEEEANARVFNLLVRGVGGLAAARDRREARQVALATRAKLLLVLGYMPELDSCVECGSREMLCAFRASAGGVVCTDCSGSEAHEHVHVGATGLQALRELLEQPLRDVGGLSVPDEAQDEIERVIATVLAYHG